MTARRLFFVLLLMLTAEGILALKGSSRERAAATRRPADAALLQVAEVERAHRIVVREKPQTKVVVREDGFEMRRIHTPDEPARETVLERQGDHWVVQNAYGLDADPEWLGQTVRDLNQGRLVRFLTSDPSLAEDLALDTAEVRLEDGSGRVIRRLEFGRKDGGDAYQFVRIDGRSVFVARHETELLGDPLAWIARRVLRFPPEAVRELTLPSPEGPLRLVRSQKGAPLELDGPPSPSSTAISAKAESTLAALLAAPIKLVLERSTPMAKAARGRLQARVDLALFDGRRYRIGYGVAPAADRGVTELGYAASDLVFAFIDCTDAKDLAVRYGERVALVYDRAATLDRLSADRSAPRAR